MPQEMVEFKGPCFGQRHILVFLASLGLLISYCMRINISIALVVMVNNSESATANGSSSTECMELIDPIQNTSSNNEVSTDDFHWSKQIQSILLSSFFWGYAVFQIPAGTYAQRFGGKWIVVLGIASTAIFTFLTPAAAKINVNLVIVLRILEGIGESIAYPALQAMLGRWVPLPEAAFLNAFCFLGSSLGSIIGIISSRAICFNEDLGWPAVFYIDGALAIIWLIPWCLLVFDVPIEHPGISDAERCYLLETTARNQARINKLGVPWKSILSDKGTWAYVVGWVTYSWVINSILTTLPDFLFEILHYDISSNEFASLLSFLFLCIFQIVFAYASDQIINRTNLSRTIVRKMFTCTGLCGIVACFVAVTFTGCDVLKTGILLVLSFTTTALLYGGVFANPVEMCPEFSGTLFGISNSIGALTAIIAPIVTDKMTTHGSRSEWNDVFFVTAAIAFTGAIIYLLFGTGKRRKWLDLPSETRELVSSTALLYDAVSTNA